MTEQGDELRKIFNSALLHLTSNRLEEAKQGFLEVLSINPRSAEAYLNLGNVDFQQKNMTDAITNFAKAIELDPTLVKAYMNIGSAYFKQNDYDSAIGYWNIATHIAPENALIHRNIAVAYENAGNMQKAFKHYEQFLKHNTKNDLTAGKIRRKVDESKRVAYHNLNAGVENQKYKRWSHALVAYQKSIEIYPNFAKAHLNLGSIFYQNEKIEDAIRCWEDALRLEPEHANTHCNLAIAYEKENQPDEAYVHYKLYLEYSHGRSKDAPQVKQRTEELEQILTGKRELIRQHVNKGNELFRQRKYEEAIYEFEKYIMLNTSGTDVQSIRDRIEEAKTRLNPVEKAKEVALKMGDEYYEKALFDKALTAYTRYLNLNPKGTYANEVKKRIEMCHKNISNVVSAMLKSD